MLHLAYTALTNPVVVQLHESQSSLATSRIEYKYRAVGAQMRSKTRLW